MSFQPLPPPPQAPPATSADRSSSSSGRGVVRAVGIVLIVGGLIGAAGLFLAQQRAQRTAVENLQRGGSGLRTEFIFEKEGTFTLYYEYAGSFTTEIGGDEETFEADARPEPRRLDVRLLDADGDDVRLLRDVPDVSYDVAGYTGVVYKQVRIRDTGKYILEVGAKDDDFAIAVGAGVVRAPSPLAAIGVGLAGIVLGILCLVTLGRRGRDSSPPAPVAVGWPPAPIDGPAPWGATPMPPPPGSGSWAPTGPPTPAAPPLPPQPPFPPQPPAGSWPPPPPT